MHTLIHVNDNNFVWPTQGRLKALKHIGQMCIAIFGDDYDRRGHKHSLASSATSARNDHHGR